MSEREPNAHVSHTTSIDIRANVIAVVALVVAIVALVVALAGL